LVKAQKESKHATKIEENASSNFNSFAFSIFWTPAKERR